jgi:radical SAM-linked protein
VRFISHRDLARAFERAFRIVELPLAFTGGFSPRPKVSFGLALPVGAESDAEYLDVELTEPVDLDVVVPAINAALPEGIVVLGAVELDDRAPSLQEAVTLTTWLVEAHGVRASDLADAIGKAMAAERLDGVRRRKGVDTVEDLRPAIAALRIVEPADLAPLGLQPDELRPAVGVEMELRTVPRSVRPGEVFSVLAAGLVNTTDFTGDGPSGRVIRIHQWIERDGARHEPLDADTRPRVLEARA